MNDTDIFGDASPAKAKGDSDIFKDLPAPTRPPSAAPRAPSRPLPENAGLASFMASTLGLPVDTIQNALNLGIAGAGVATGKTPELIQGSVGGSEWIKNKLRQSGQPGLSPDNPDTSNDVSKAQYEMMARGGFIPGGVLPAAASIAAEKYLGPEWGGVASLLPQSAMAVANKMTAPGRQAAQEQNTLRDATLREAQGAGYVVPPSAVEPSFVGNRLESIAGKAAISQEAAARNQGVTNELARKELGLPKNGAISVQALENKRNQLAAPYREVSMLDPEAADALKKLKQSRFDANNYYRHYDMSADPESLTKAQGFAAESKRLEGYIEDIASNAGKPKLVEELRDARVKIAKTFDVERALNVATGDVSAATLGKMVDKGKPVSGGLATAGKFQQAFPSYARDGEKIPTPGVSKSEALASSVLGLGGYAALGPYGAAMAALPLASGPVRSGLLSRYGQSKIQPDYSGLRLEPDIQMLLRLGILNQPQGLLNP